MAKILLFGSLIITVFSSTSAFCDPEKYEYFRYQTPNECGKCDICVVGEGKLTLEESGIPLDPVEGSRVCIPCRPCKDGTYSDKRSNDCSLCTNCTAQFKVTVQTCTKEKDAVCGVTLPSTTIRPKPEPLALSEDIDTKETQDVWLSKGVMIGMIAGFVVVAAIMLLAILIIGRKIRRTNVIDNEYRSCSQTDVEAQNSVEHTSSPGPSQSFQIPPEMKFETAIHAQDLSAASSSDDEGKALLKPSKRRGSYPGRSKSSRKIPRKHASPNCDLQVDCDTEGHRTKKDRPRIQRLMSYPLDKDQNRQRNLNDGNEDEEAKEPTIIKNTSKKPKYKCSCDEKLYNSSCYQRHLSLLLSNGDLYKTFGQQYLENSSYHLIMREVGEKVPKEQSFGVVEKVFQVRTDLTKEDVNNFLKNNNRQQDIKTLERIHR